MAHDFKDLEERFLSKLLLDPNQVSTTGLQPEDFSSQLVRAAFSAILEVLQTHGLCKDFLYLTCEAMKKNDFIQNGTVSPCRYLDRISRLETTAQGVNCLAAKIKANSPRVQREMEQIVENSIADRILTALRNSQTGLSRSGLNNLFGRHKTRAQLQRAINSLIKIGLITQTKKRTSGRSIELLVAKNAK